jgi:hypothetical protein
MQQKTIRTYCNTYLTIVATARTIKLATLDKIQSELNRRLPDQKQIHTLNSSPKGTIGRRRRAWLVDESGDKLETNWDESGDKLETKWDESGDKLETKWDESGDKLETKWDESGDKLETKWGQTGDKLETKWDESGDKLETKWGQTGDKVGTKLETKLETKKGGFSSISEVMGQQKSLLIFVYQECKKSRMKNTNPLPLDYITSYTNIAKPAVKKAFKRLEDKKLIIRKEYKNGRGGWTKYELPDGVFHHLLQLEKDQKLETKVETKVETNPPPSSSISSLVVTREDLKTSLPEGWDDVIWNNLSKIGFVREHLHQLCKNENLTPQIVQDSIDAFAFDLEENGKAEKIKGSPLAYFIGILRKGIPYTPPENYESPETVAFRRYVEHRERQKAAREDLEKRNYELDLDDWIEKQTEEELNQAIEEPRYRDKNSPFRRGALSLYFKKNIWTPLRLKDSLPIEEPKLLKKQDGEGSAEG